MSRKPRPKSIHQLRQQLSKPMPDPKGDRLRRKITSIEPSEGPFWIEWRLAPQRVILGRGPKPTLGRHLCVVSTLTNPVEILLVYHNQEAKPVKYLIVPHPGDL